MSSIIGHSQNVFEKGYFIDRAGKKVECYVLTETWSTDGYLTYRNSYKEPARSKPLAEISEVSVTGAFKIIHTQLQIDLSGDTPTLLGYTRDPEWSSQDAFLWTLVEGVSNLYVYENEGLKRYFYSTESVPVEQLVFKKYKTTSGIEVNDLFKQTLFDEVNCSKNLVSYFNGLSYTEEDLVRHFLQENKCTGLPFASYLQRNTKEAPNLNSLNTIESPPQVKNTTPTVKTGKSPNAIRYFGLEVNQLLQQIIDLNSNNNAPQNPYAIQYASNSRQTGRGVSYGLAYGRNKFTDDTNGAQRETINRSISFRIGYERKVNWGKRWIALHGYDLTLGGSKLNTTNNQGGQNFEIESKSNFWGFGPRVGLMYGISPRVFLGSEAIYYLKFIKDAQTITNGQPNSSQKSTDFSLTLPVSLFLTVKLNE